MKATLRFLTCICLLPALTASVGPIAAHADAVMDWNEIALDSVVAAKQTPPMTTRSMAMVHAAMFDAVNAIEPHYRPYKVKVDAAPGTSSDAAASAAAHLVLIKLFPDQQAALDKAYDAALATIAEGGGRNAGVRLGEQVAGEIISWRANDGIGAPNTYRPATTPGVYVPTVLPISSDWPQSKPWLMDHADQFRPGPPPALTSDVWTRDYNEIKVMGGRGRSERTPEQTVIGQFWSLTGAPSFNPIARQLASAHGLSPVENARLFALTYFAATDALVAVFDAKYAYNFWRPITAIRNGDIDGNDKTAADAGWMPLIDTPIHPEYPCAHCTNAAAVGAVLEAQFGSGAVAPFTMTSPATPGVVRKWDRIDAYVEEVSNARIWSGVHYRNSATVGREMGRKIGMLAVENSLRPLK
jgi:hypothetical protein